MLMNLRLELQQIPKFRFSVRMSRGKKAAWVIFDSLNHREVFANTQGLEFSSYQAAEDECGKLNRACE